MSESALRRIWWRRVCVRQRSRTLCSLTWQHILWVIPVLSSASSADFRTLSCHVGRTIRNVLIAASLPCCFLHIHPMCLNLHSPRCPMTTTKSPWNECVSCWIWTRIKRARKTPATSCFGPSLLHWASEFHPFHSAKCCYVYQHFIASYLWYVKVDLNRFTTVVYCVGVIANKLTFYHYCFIHMLIFSLNCQPFSCHFGRWCFVWIFWCLSLILILFLLVRKSFCLKAVNVSLRFWFQYVLLLAFILFSKHDCILRNLLTYP